MQPVPSISHGGTVEASPSLVQLGASNAALARFRSSQDLQLRFDHAVGRYDTRTKTGVVAEPRGAIWTYYGIGSAHVQIYMRVVMGCRYTCAFEFLHANFYFRQAVIILELWIIGHIASYTIWFIDLSLLFIPSAAENLEYCIRCG